MNAKKIMYHAGELLAVAGIFVLGYAYFVIVAM
jgi:hypothetical protein